MKRLLDTNFGSFWFLDPYITQGQQKEKQMLLPKTLIWKLVWKSLPLWLSKASHLGSWLSMSDDIKEFEAPMHISILNSIHTHICKNNFVQDVLAHIFLDLASCSRVSRKSPTYYKQFISVKGYVTLLNGS